MTTTTKSAAIIAAAAAAATAAAATAAAAAAAKASWNYVLDAIETIHPGPTEAGSGTIDTPNDIA